MHNEKILVVGHKGVVGNATYTLFKRLGYDIFGVDKEDTSYPKADVTFICVPEKVVTVDFLSKFKTDLMVIRSTVVPGTCKMIHRELGVHTCHNPEFLRESTAIMDSFTPERVIIGECCKFHGNILEELYEPLRKPIFRDSPEVTEMTKLAINGFLSTIISYWNEIDEISSKIGVNGTKVGMLASTDSRVGYYGSRFHTKFGGKCLPKDTNHLIDVAKENGLNPVLLDAVMEINSQIGE